MPVYRLDWRACFLEPGKSLPISRTVIESSKRLAMVVGRNPYGISRPVPSRPGWGRQKGQRHGLCAGSYSADNPPDSHGVHLAVDFDFVV